VTKDSDATRPAAAHERMVSLLMFLEHREQGAWRDEIAEMVEGFEDLRLNPEAAKKRLARNIADLAAMGVVIKVDGPNSDHYQLDPETSFSQEIELTPDQLQLLKLAGGAALQEPTFVLAEELRGALTKIAAAAGDAGSGLYSLPRSTHRTDDDDDGLVAALDGYIRQRRSIAFGYTSNDGNTRRREVDPVRLFALGDDWYLFGSDHAIAPPDQAVRQYRLAKMEDVRPLTTGPGPDFEPIAFDLHSRMDFPFAFGPEEPFEAVFLIPAFAQRTPSYVWDKARLSEVNGVPDLLVMRATARSVEAAASFAVSYAPGTVPLAPEAVVTRYREGLRREGGLDA